MAMRLFARIQQFLPRTTKESFHFVGNLQTGNNRPSLDHLELSSANRHPVRQNDLCELLGGAQTTNILSKCSGIHPETINFDALSEAQDFALLNCQVLANSAFSGFA